VLYVGASKEEAWIGLDRELTENLLYLHDARIGTNMMNILCLSRIHGLLEDLTISSLSFWESHDEDSGAISELDAGKWHEGAPN
jgi:hypothetical protein